MPVIKFTETLAANGTAFPLQGSQFEYLAQASVVQMAIMAAAGIEVDASVNFGSQVVMESSQIDEKAVTLPLTDEDYQIKDVVGAGQRLGIALRETGGAGGDVRGLVTITPL